MYFYSEIDNITLIFSDIKQNKDGMEYINLKYERPNKNGFDFAELTIPDFDFTKAFGFSEEELYYLERYAKNNAVLIWDIAREGDGIKV